MSNRKRHPVQAARILVLGLLFTPQTIFQGSSAFEAGKPICLDYTWMGITSKEFCTYSREVAEKCLSTENNSIYNQCNVFKLDIRKLKPRYDDNKQEYLSVIFKYTETNSCGNNDASAWKCDSFASYVQILRNVSNNKCYAFVNSALLGIKPTQQNERNDPNKPIKMIAIPGISRRILFTPSKGLDLLQQSNAILLRTSETSRQYIDGGAAISALSILELESPLTIKADNLKPNPGKIRLVRGDGSDSDYLDLNLSSKDEDSLSKILSSCT